MSLLVVGDGAVATALARTLAAVGVDLARWSRRRPSQTPLPSVAVLAVSDPAITEVTHRLLGEGRLDRRSVVLHCAGGLAPEAAFPGLEEQVAGRGLLHPLRAINGQEESLAGTVFAVAGDKVAVAEAKRLVGALGGLPLELASASLPRYHAAAVLAGNHTLALVEAGLGLLGSLGLERAAAERALGGLLASAAANVISRGLPAALTGSIARGDVAAVRRHLEALAAPGLGEARTLYLATARATVELAAAKGQARAEDLAALRRLLAAVEVD